MNDDRTTALTCWTRQLYREYERILFWYRISLRTPVICVRPLSGVWGRWCPVQGTITISEALIRGYPWDVVLEVLRHEMAHQMVTELWQVDDGHGPLFQQACDRLGVPAWARRASGQLPENYASALTADPNSEEQRLLRRVEKLLSLATSSNEHEAAAAMQRVREIYARHNLEGMRLGRQDAVGSLMIYLRCKRVAAVDSAIFSILTGYFFVDVVFCDLFDAKVGEEFKAVELLGTPQNLAMAEYVYHFLSYQVQSLWRGYQQQHQTSRTSRRSYQLGVLVGFRKKLAASEQHVWQQAAQESQPNCAALLRVINAPLERYVRYRHPRLVKRQTGARGYESKSFQAGHHAGQQIVLNKAVTSSAGSTSKVLQLLQGR